MLKNSLFLLLSLLLSMIVGECLLRAFTPFPVGTKTHRINDPDLGYRLSQSMGDVDEMGFRNPASNARDYRVAAIGDSNTYGNNVGSKATWPARFPALSGAKAYNLGVGGYGVYTYHALIARVLPDKSRKVIVALFPANDFGTVWSNCDVVRSPSAFWIREKQRLRLKGFERTASRPRLCEWEGTEPGWKTWMVEHTAIASAIYRLVVPSVERLFAAKAGTDENYYHFPAGIPSISRAYVKENAQLSNPDDPDTAQLFEDFTRLASDWQAQGGGRVGLLLVPSKERMIFEALRSRNALDQADPAFIRDVVPEIALERMVLDFARSKGILAREAIGPMSAALDAAIKRGEPFYPEDDGHPTEAGYLAIAIAATSLFHEMNGNDGTGK